MEALFVVAAIVAAFGFGHAVGFKRATLPSPIAPRSLPAHVDTLRAVLDAAGELTPEVEAWVRTLAEPVKALPASASAPVTDRWPCFIKEWNAEPHAPAALDILRQYAPSIRWTIDRKCQIVKDLASASARATARQIVDSAWRGIS